jgi:hypothetical protein
MHTEYGRARVVQNPNPNEGTTMVSCLQNVYHLGPCKFGKQGNFNLENNNIVKQILKKHSSYYK